MLVVVLGEGTDHLAPRPKRRSAPTLPAATPIDMDASSGRVRCKVLNEPGLADPRLPRDQEQSFPAADRVIEAGHEFRQFAVSAHKDPRS